MSFLNNHPFAVEAFFESSLVLTFAVPKKELIQMIPECLELDSFEEKWGFVAVALVKTKNLRPKGFPAFMGNDFVLAGFRVFVRYTNTRGKRLRGLYILKSETNKKRMAFWGNIFTHYKYTSTDIRFIKNKDNLVVCSDQSGLAIEVTINKTLVDLPKDSPFKDWQEARRFAGPLPFTFTYNKKTREVLIIEGIRQNWVPRPVEVLKHNISFINEKRFNGILLANAFLIENIPYYWKKGKLETWKG